MLHFADLSVLHGVNRLAGKSWLWRDDFLGI
jgi:hypothetical protein